MLCYKDRTFCSAYGKTCGNSQCSRALTKEVVDGATEWSAGFSSLPLISQGDLRPSCPIFIPLQKEQTHATN